MPCANGRLLAGGSGTPCEPGCFLLSKDSLADILSLPVSILDRNLDAEVQGDGGSVSYCAFPISVRSTANYGVLIIDGDGQHGLLHLIGGHPNQLEGSFDLELINQELMRGVAFSISITGGAKTILSAAHTPL